MRRTSSAAPLIAFAALMGLSAGAATAGEGRKPTVTRVEYDPSAREVELFAALEEGELDARLIPKDSKGGNLLIENKTDKPLTVKMPAGFVGVHVFKQFDGGGGMDAGGMGMGGLGAGGQGGGQPMGGGMMGGGMMGGGMGGMGMGGMGMGGGGFFSIPAETVARLPFKSVCLAHGKPEPTPRMAYELRPVEEFTGDPTLQALIGLVGSGKMHPDAAQAAAWHLTDGMSWGQLASLKTERLGGLPATPVFAPGELLAAQNIVAAAAARAEKIAAAKEKGDVTEEVSTEKNAPKPIRGRIR